FHLDRPVRPGHRLRGRPHPKGPRRAARREGRARRRRHLRQWPQPLLPPAQLPDAPPGVDQDLRLRREAPRAARRHHAALRRTRDSGRVRGRLWSRRAGALPQPSVHCAPGLMRLCLALTIIAALFVPATRARAADPQVDQTVVQSGPAVASDLYAFGAGVDIQADVQGDLVAAGGRVVTGGRVQGNLIGAAGSVDLSGTVNRNVRGAGGAVTINGHVGRNLNVGGGTVVLTPDAVIDGRARLVGGEIRVAGKVARKLYAAAAVIVLVGEVEGDVELVAQEIEVLPTARIKGTLTYWSPRDAAIDRPATIQGGVIHNLPPGLPRALP